LQQALERDRTLFEHRCQEVETEPVAAMVRPMNLGLYLADMAAWPFGNARRLEWLGANDAFRRWARPVGHIRPAAVSRHAGHQ
jgi:hypothetical protein